MRLFGSLRVFAEARFFMPPIRAQKLLRLLAAFEPFFNLDGGVVTAVWRLEPGFALR